MLAAVIGMMFSSCEKFTSGGKVPEGAVDLGLSVYWAECNLGADYPEKWGDRYAWAETETKKDFTVFSYKWMSGTPLVYWKYTTEAYRSTVDQYGGVVDNKTQLEMDDDAARAKLGGKWRLPTGAELKELKNECTWEWQEAAKGFRVTGPNGNSIFLPSTISIHSTGNVEVSLGFYWSSTLCIDAPNSAWTLMFSSTGVEYKNYTRYEGCSIRPVIK